MNLAEIGPNIQVKENYRIEFPEEDFLGVCVNAEYGSPAAKFDHPNIASANRKIMSFKHYSRTRGKWWTEKPGVSYSFVIPKDKIELDTEKSGYSYVYVKINDKRYCLSVSGGGSSGSWVDYVSQFSSVGMCRSKKDIQPIADAATLDGQFSIAHKMMDESDQEHYRRLCAFYDTRSKLKEGDKVFLAYGYSFNSSQGPFDIVRRPARKRHFLCSGGMYDRIHISYAKIDWVKTAEANGVDLIN